MEVEKLKKVFCEYDFWKKFMEIRPNNIMPNETMQRWLNIFAICCKSNLQMDITDQELKTLIHSDISLQMLWKKSTNGECGFDCTKETFVHVKNIADENINNDILNSVFFSCEDEDICEKESENYGIKILNINTLERNDNIYEVTISTINKTIKENPNINWKKLTVTNHRCNALILVDGYLLKKEDLIDYNLIPILGIYLPPKLSVSFNISIFTNSKTKMNKNEFVSDVDLKELHKSISDKISKIRPNLNFTLGIFNMNGRLHDRTIMTNYIYVCSGAGFDLIDKDKTGKYLRFTKRTTITAFYPFAVQAAKGAGFEYFSLRNTLKYISENEDTEYYGEKVNRLIE